MATLQRAFAAVSGMNVAEWIAFISMLVAVAAAAATLRNTLLMRRMYELSVESQRRTEPAVKAYLADFWFSNCPPEDCRVYVVHLVITNQSLAANSIKHITLSLEYGPKGAPLSNVTISHTPGVNGLVNVGTGESFRIPRPVAAGESVDGIALFPVANAILGDSVVKSHSITILDAYDRETNCHPIVLRELRV